MSLIFRHLVAARSQVDRGAIGAPDRATRSLSRSRGPDRAILTQTGLNFMSPIAETTDRDRAPIAY